MKGKREREADREADIQVNVNSWSATHEAMTIVDLLQQTWTQIRR